MPHLDVLWNGSDNVGQSSAILDAMAAGVPVIASDTPTNQELVVENETGYLIPLGNRAGRAARARLTDGIFTDVTLAARLAAGGQRRVAEDFCAERMMENHMRIYENVLC
jgi:glycosyltransferase involved in cell wall biosynthesis